MREYQVPLNETLSKCKHRINISLIPSDRQRLVFLNCYIVVCNVSETFMDSLAFDTGDFTQSRFSQLIMSSYSIPVSLIFMLFSHLKS